MKYLQGEKELITTSNNHLILTNYRIIKSEQVWGKSYRIDIFLENISSVESQFKSYPILLLLAVLGIIGGIFSENIEVGIALGVFFVLIWWFSRKHLITIMPDGGNPLNILAERMTQEKINELMFFIQQAKFLRTQELYIR